MRKYVTENILYCIKKNQVFPQDVQIRENQFLHFGKIGLTVYRLTNQGETFKHVNYWQNMTADEINQAFNGMDWEK